MKLTIAKRLIPIIATAVLGVSIMAGISNYMTNKVYDSTNYANINIIPSLQLLDQLRKNFLLTRLDMDRLLFALKGHDNEGLSEQIAQTQKTIASDFHNYEFDGCLGISCIADIKDKNYLEQEKVLWDEIRISLEQALLKSRQGTQGLEEANILILNTAAVSTSLQITFDQHFDYNTQLGVDSAKAANQFKEQALIYLLVIAVLTLILIGLIGYYSTRSILHQLGGEPEDAAAIATELALGNLTHTITLKPGDNSSLMARMKQLITAMGMVAERADAVGQGNLQDEVVVLSDQDRLGQAINHMVVALRTARIVDDKRNWLNTGNHELTQTLTGDFSDRQIASLAISCMARYLSAGRGVIYALHGQNQPLELIGSYMYSAAPEQFQSGEGAIGQAAQDQRPIFLTVIGPQAAPIVTGTSSTAAQFIYVYPVLNDQHTLAVLELSSFTLLTELQLDYLAAAVELLGSYLYIAQQRGQISQLLQVAEQAERDVRLQNESLQEINARMEEQQQQLQQQSEELQQSNAQMEEQQQQLQQQAEELQQTNAQMEEQQQLLEQNNQNLRQSQNDIDEKAKQLALSNHYKSEFLANMSHELRTPLNAIILLSKMMLDNPDGNLRDSELKRAEVIHRSGHDLLRLISDVLDLSKVDAGRMDLHLVNVTSATIAAEMRDLFDSVAQQNGIDLVINDALRGGFSSDYEKVSQIMRNLLSNAFKFTKQGHVTLKMERLPQEPLPIRFSVQDTGIGIPAANSKTVFDAFRQVDGSTSREYGGTGLGLTISLRFAQLLGGTILLSSIEAQGSIFTLCLPELPPSSDVAPSQPEAIPLVETVIPDDRSNLAPHDKIILLIDDDANFGSAVVEINHRLGYKTIVAQNGAEGLQMARQYHPNGILLDLGLPDKDGSDILHELKSSRDLSGIPVYIISGRDHDSALNERGIIGYLQKPVVSSQIAEAEAELMSALAQAPSGDILVVSAEPQNFANIQNLLQMHRGENSYAISQVSPGAELHQALDLLAWGVIIIDLAGLSIAQGLNVAETVHSSQSDAAMLFFGVAELNEESEASLRCYSDSIIIQTPHAGVRLQENIERFLRTVPKPVKINTPVARTSEKLKDKTILVIDDDPRNLFVITAALEQQGAQVFNALNGRRALDMLDKAMVDLIITDIMMPEMDGYQTITAIRANPKLFPIPVIALTAKAMPQDRKNILEIGADDYLSKPVDYDVLSNIASFWCSRQHG